MNKKLPRVVAVPLKKDISHNRGLFYSAKDETKTALERSDAPLTIMSQEEVLKRIEAVFHSTHHSFHIPVVIQTKNQTYHTKLIGKFNDRLLTMDDQEILIRDITYFKEE